MTRSILRPLLLVLAGSVLAPLLEARPQTSLIRTDPPAGWEGFLMRTTVETGFIPAGSDLSNPTTPRASVTQTNTSWVNPALPYPPTADVGVPTVTSSHTPDTGNAKDISTATVDFFYRLQENAADEWGFDIDTTTSAVNARANFGSGLETADSFVEVTLTMTSEGPYLVPDAYMALPELPALTDPTQQQLFVTAVIGHPGTPCPTGTESVINTAAFGYQTPPAASLVFPFHLCDSYPDPGSGLPVDPDDFSYELHYTVVTPFGVDPPFTIGGIGGGFIPSPIVVTNTNDAGPGSLRQTIADTVDGDFITFDPSLSAQIINLTSGELLISGKSITIDATSLELPITVDGGGSARILRIDPTGGASLLGLALRNGATTADGGAIFNEGSLQLSNSSIRESEADGSGGGLANDGGTVTMSRCLVTENTSTSNGGGIYNRAGDLTLTDCEISHNSSSGDGGGIFSWRDGIAGRFTSRLTNCSLHNNTAQSGGGLLCAGEDGDFDFPENKTWLINTTVALNEAEIGGGAVSRDDGVLVVFNSTVANNTASDSFGGLYSEGGIIAAFSSIASGNNPTDIDWNVAGGAIETAGYNLIGTGDIAALFTAGGDQTGIADPKLSGLGKFGGSTPTMLPLAGSPAIDTGDARTLTPATDQRGFPRAADGDLNGSILPDVGAAEVTAPTLIVTNGNDSGPGSLRQVVADIPDGGQVLFADYLGGGFTSLTSGEIAITGKTIAIDARNAARSEGETFRVNAGKLSRVFSIASSATVTMSSLAIQQGVAPALDNRGGGILNEGDLTLVNCEFDLCQATIGTNPSGGGIHNAFGAILSMQSSVLFANSAGDGGGLANRGEVTMTNCRALENTAVRFGGGIYNDSAILTADHCEFQGNRADGDGGALAADSASTTLNNCAIFGNRAGILGGGLSSTFGAMDLEQCTLYGNSSAGAGGGLRTGYGGFTTLRHCTVTLNNSESGTGSGIAALLLGSTIQCFSSIISGNRHDADAYRAPAGVILSDGYNLVGGGNALASFSSAGDQPGITDPLLGPLGANGGNTASMYPLPGSPATDAGSTDASSPATDQRGDPRSADGDGNSTVLADIGAVEATVPTILTVINTNDSGPGSLRDAVANATTRGTQITFAPALDGTTINLTSGELDLEERSIFIDAGPLAAGLTIDAGGNSQLLSIRTDSSATMKNLTFSGGFDHDEGGAIETRGGLKVLDSTFTGNVAGDGAGIACRGLALTLENCQFQENTADQAGGGVWIHGRAITVIADSSFSGNTADNNGGAVSLFDGAGAAGMTAYLDRCLFEGNSANLGGAANIGGPNGALRFARCTFTGNSGTWGGALRCGLGGHTLIEQCTLENNTTANLGGAIYHTAGQLDCNLSTITGNTAPPGSGGGICVQRLTGAISIPTAHLLSTIVSGNSGSDVDEDGALASFVSEGNNLIGFGSAVGRFSAPNDQTLVNNPRLAPLANYGGPTPSMHPLPGSPVIDAGGFGSLSVIPATDQRGFARVVDGDGIGGPVVDIGAVEFAPLALQTLTVTNLDDFGPGSLREAIEHATPGTLINFDSPLDGGVIASTGNASIQVPFVKIDASGLPNGITIDAQYIARILEVKATGVVDLCALTLEHGYSLDCGGGIFNEGILTLTDCTVQDCLAFKDGGGICNQGGRLVLRNSTLARNFAKDFNNPGTGRGGGLYSSGGLVFNTVAIDHCTIANCSSGEFGGGIYNFLGHMNLRHSTVAENSADSAGAGVATFGDLSTETHVFSSIIAGNPGTDVDFVLDPSNQFFSGGSNLIGTGNATAAFGASGDFPNIAHPHLSPLGKYGGPTATILPRCNSFALDGGGSDTLTPATDQRGLPRLLDLGHDGIVRTDIGAVEIGPLPFPTNIVTVTDPTDFTAGSLRTALASDIIPGTLVLFDSALDGSTLPLAGGEIPVNGIYVKIDARALANGLELNGAGNRIFSTESQTEVEICGLTLRDGQSIGAGGGAIRNEGFLTVRECSFENNEATDGGAIANEFGQLTLLDSTFTMNIAENGGAVHHDGDLFDRTTTVDQCTFAENFATIYGGALFNQMGILKVRHSTISANEATDAGAGIATNGDSSVETRLFSTIASGNNGEDLAIVLDPLDRYVSDGGNLIGTTTGTTAFPGIEDQVGITNPGLSGLGHHGGRTMTMVVEFGSPARDAGGTDPDSRSTDQRGFTRNFGQTDIGAYEASGAGGYFVWASEFIPPGDDGSFTGNADEDRKGNGAEYGIDTNPDRSDPGSPNNPELAPDGAEWRFSFGIRPEAFDVVWRVMRSTDLQSWTELYRYDGLTETVAPDVTPTLDLAGRRITVIDNAPPAGRAFYRLEVLYTP